MSDSIVQNLLALPFSLRQKRLARSRRPPTEMEFVQQIGDEGGDRDAALSVWRRLTTWGYIDGFTPYPTDSLSNVFGIAEEELEVDILQGILTELGAPMPTQELCDRFGPIDTPLQVARFIALCRKSAVSNSK
jgi:hypothetical protein